MIHPEGDCDAALETDNTKAGLDIVASRTSFRQGRKAEAVISDACHVVQGARRAGLVGDEIVEIEKIGSRLRPESDAMNHAWSVWRGRRGGYCDRGCITSAPRSIGNFRVCESE